MSNIPRIPSFVCWVEHAEGFQFRDSLRFFFRIVAKNPDWYQSLEDSLSMRPSIPKNLQVNPSKKTKNSQNMTREMACIKYPKKCQKIRLKSGQRMPERCQETQKNLQESQYLTCVQNCRFCLVAASSTKAITCRPLRCQLFLTIYLSHFTSGGTSTLPEKTNPRLTAAKIRPYRSICNSLYLMENANFGLKLVDFLKLWFGFIWLIWIWNANFGLQLVEIGYIWW